MISGLRLIAALGVAAAVSACSTDSGFRDTSKPIMATTRFDPAAMQGKWIVRARVAGPDARMAGAPESFEFGAVTGVQIAVIWSHRSCTETGCVDMREPLTAQITGAGRYVLAREDGKAVEHSVMWADADYRVAAIGTPSGAFGWIMTKGPARSDLMQAAREIMEWNGYDLARLVPVTP